LYLVINDEIYKYYLNPRGSRMNVLLQSSQSFISGIFFFFRIKYVFVS